MPSFGSASLAALSKCHPKLKIIALAAIKEIDFRILDATRGRDAQERAFATGKSKARFGQSAHNYVPAIAFDLFPAPYDWNNRQSFISLSKVILRIGKENGIPLRWGGDWNGDGNLSDGWDMPHYELTPWREWAKQSHLFEG
ncbi:MULTISPECIES: M15 family metallopeptidase [Rhizobium]|uniref:M15 family metallopeptidase n=1 Tax=Rhizobium TaxID=379 RepID=UPI001442732A|nr:M15 family metallopeptidase [Rhizobium leguminosarum]